MSTVCQCALVNVVFSHVFELQQSALCFFLVPNCSHVPVMILKDRQKVNLFLQKTLQMMLPQRLLKMPTLLAVRLIIIYELSGRLINLIKIISIVFHFYIGQHACMHGKCTPVIGQCTLGKTSADSWLKNSISASCFSLSDFFCLISFWRGWWCERTACLVGLFYVIWFTTLMNLHTTSLRLWNSCGKPTQFKWIHWTAAGAKKTNKILSNCCHHESNFRPHWGSWKPSLLSAIDITSDVIWWFA